MSDGFNPYESGNILDSSNLPEYARWDASGYGSSFYYIRGESRVSAVNAFNEYFFTSFGNHIYYINGKYSKARPLEGTFAPRVWEAETEYKRGDVVSPTNANYNGYVYVCINLSSADAEEEETFESGSTEPTWVENLSESITDGDVRWRGIGSLEIEGNSAKDLLAKCLAVYKGFLVVGNTIEDGEYYPSRIRWSQWLNPRLWHNNEDGSGLCGYVDTDDIQGQIMNLKVLGDTLYVYKENCIIGITYTGGEDITFSKEVVTNKTGLVAQDAIIEMPHYHIFIGKDNIYLFDGNSCTPIGNPVINYVQKTIDYNRAYRTFGYYDEDNADAIFAFSSIKNKSRQISEDKLTEDCDLALIYNVTYKTWSIREMYMTAAGKYRSTKDRVIDDVSDEIDALSDTLIDGSLYTKNTDITIMGDQFGYFYIKKGYKDETHDSLDGGYDGYIITKTHHMDAPQSIKRLLRIQFHIETLEDYGLYVQVGTSWNAETNQIEWTPKHYLNLNKPVPWYSHHVAPFIDVDLSARYFVIRFGTEHKDEPFKILGYTLFYQIRSDE